MCCSVQERNGNAPIFILQTKRILGSESPQQSPLYPSKYLFRWLQRPQRLCFALSLRGHDDKGSQRLDSELTENQAKDNSINLILPGGNAHSGVANIEPRKGSRVPVGIWSITQGDERNLDRYEGYPWLYDKHEFRVKLPDLRTVSAIAYIMTPGRRWAAPSPYYLHTIKQGYEDFGFDRRNLLYAARTPVKGVSA